MYKKYHKNNETLSAPNNLAVARRKELDYLIFYDTFLFLKL